jgi:hypothetical protein
MTKAEAMRNFWNSFGIPAYEENSLPTGIPFPYITYQLVEDSFGNEVAMSANIWDKDSDGHSALKTVSIKADEISEYIGRGGVLLPVNGGKIWVKRGSPFAQTLADEDRTVKRKYLNIVVEYFTAN